LNIVRLQCSFLWWGIGNGSIFHVIEALFIAILLVYIAYCLLLTEIPGENTGFGAAPIDQSYKGQRAKGGKA
jgi:hypothetical protein